MDIREIEKFLQYLFFNDETYSIECNNCSSGDYRFIEDVREDGDLSGIAKAVIEHRKFWHPAKISDDEPSDEEVAAAINSIQEVKS